VNASLGGWAAHHADRLARAFPSTGVCLSSLAAHGQPAKVPNATIAFDALQALEIHADFPAQVTFNNVLAVLNGVNNLRELLLR